MVPRTWDSTKTAVGLTKALYTTSFQRLKELVRLTPTNAQRRPSPLAEIEVARTSPACSFNSRVRCGIGGELRVGMPGFQVVTCRVTRDTRLLPSGEARGEIEEVTRIFRWKKGGGECLEGTCRVYFAEEQKEETVRAGSKQKCAERFCDQVVRALESSWPSTRGCHQPERFPTAALVSFELWLVLHTIKRFLAPMEQADSTRRCNYRDNAVHIDLF